MGKTKILILHQEFSGYSLLSRFAGKINFYFPPSRLVPDFVTIIITGVPLWVCANAIKIQVK